MGFWSNTIANLVGLNIISGRKNTAANVRAVFGGVQDAVAFLEGLARGSQILKGTTAPDGTTVDAQGNAPLAGDAYINTVTSDFYQLDAVNGWQLHFRLKGADGKTPRKGVDYQDGRTPVKGVDYQDGVDGKSAYQLWQAQSPSNTLTLPAWLASLVGKGGDPGQRGNVNRWESYAPTTEAGLPGDAWFRTVSATKLEIHECLASGSWGLRFTSPEAAATVVGSSGGVTSFNTRTGPVQLTAADVNAVLTQGDNITLAVSGGKVVVSAAAPTSAGHVFKDASGSTITQPTIVVQKGVRLLNDAANNQMSLELDPAGAPASEGNQAGVVVDFAFRYQNRAAGSGNITLSDFQSIGVGGKCRIELNSTASADQLIFGGQTVTGADASFQATVKVSATPASGTNQVVTFYDVGGPFVGGVKNVLKLECIGTNRFDFSIEPQV